jgi:hypothetical protein
MTKTYMEWGDAKAKGPAGFVNNSRLSRKVCPGFSLLASSVCAGVKADQLEDLCVCQGEL